MLGPVKKLISIIWYKKYNLTKPLSIDRLILYNIGLYTSKVGLGHTECTYNIHPVFREKERLFSA